MSCKVALLFLGLWSFRQRPWMLFMDLLQLFSLGVTAQSSLFTMGTIASFTRLTFSSSVLSIWYFQASRVPSSFFPMLLLLGIATSSYTLLLVHQVP